MAQNINADRVADAPADIWVYTLLPKSVWPYAQLARWDRPIGWWLLLWPCWWSSALAVNFSVDQSQQGVTSATVLSGAGLIDLISITVTMLILFWLGAVAMRGAGCTYNDLVDAKLDMQVARTASRPIPSGRVSKKQTLGFVLAQALVGFICLLALCLIWQDQFNFFAFVLGISSLGIVAFYPFAKRITDWPQFVLGLAFSWGALMGWAVVWGELSMAPIFLYAGCILWTIGYDTIYAHQDKEDDALIGVRSTARLFGERTKPVLILLYFATLALFALAFFGAGAGWPSFIGLAAGCGHMIWQIKTLDIDDPDKCLSLFQSNAKFGWIIFAGLLADLMI